MSNEIVSTNPSKDYEEIGRIQISSKDEIEKCVSAAREALKTWQFTPLSKRLSYISEIHDAYLKRLNEVAELQAKEMGKSIKESTEECNTIAEWMQWHIKNAERILSPRTLDELEGYRTELHFEPFGVVAAIIPWNYPSYLFFLDVLQPLIVGNVIVAKHSEECVLSAKLLQDIVDSTSLPENVLQSVFGAGETGAQLIEQNIDFVSFTGSSKTGEYIYQQAAKKFIPALLEMGGSSPGILFDDADLNSTCDAIYAERFSNCGQVCSALKRLLVHQDIYDEAINRLKTIIESKVVDDALDQTTDIGPLVAKRQLLLLEEQVQDAVSKGASIVTGGKRPENLKGAFYSPTLITEVSKDMRVWSEEVFGPVLPIIPFSTEEEAIKLANDTPYGLSAYVYTNDMARAERISRNLQAGQISINGCSFYSDAAPFGGYKKSGIGRGDGEYGYYSVSQMKVIAKPC